MNNNIPEVDVFMLLQSDDYKQKLLGEYYEIRNRIYNLGKFISKLKKGKIEDIKTPISLLEKQLKILRDYEKILSDRCDIDEIQL
ncbi:MAG: hypothetical protein WCS17_13335 [Prevotella sp.]